MILRQAKTEVVRETDTIDSDGGLKPTLPRLERPATPAEQFVEEMCRLLGVEPERPANRARDRLTAETRRMVTTLGVERWDQKRRNIVTFLGITRMLCSTGLARVCGGASRTRTSPGGSTPTTGNLRILMSPRGQRA